MPPETSFERRKRISTYWLNKANDLMAAAAAVHASLGEPYSSEITSRFNLGTNFSMAAAVPPVLHMLCGMSLELTYKAVIVSRRLEVPHTHDLSALARHSGLTLSTADDELHQIWSESIKWEGRYPVPRDIQGWTRHHTVVRRRLYESVPGLGGHFVRPNGDLSWGSFVRLRRQALDLYVDAVE